MTDACGRPDGKAPEDLPFEVRYTASDGVEHIAGYTLNPEVVDLIDELTAEWVKLWVIDTTVKPPKTIKVITP